MSKATGGCPASRRRRSIRRRSGRTPSARPQNWTGMQPEIKRPSWLGSKQAVRLAISVASTRAPRPSKRCTKEVIIFDSVESRRAHSHGKKRIRCLSSLPISDDSGCPCSALKSALLEPAIIPLRRLVPDRHKWESPADEVDRAWLPQPTLTPVPTVRLQYRRQRP